MVQVCRYMRGWTEHDYLHSSPRFLKTILSMMLEEAEAHREAAGVEASQLIE